MLLLSGWIGFQAQSFISIDNIGISVWGNYWVIDLDPQYQLAAVSEPSRKYLWILSRSKTVEPKAYEALLQRLKQKGFNLDAIEISKQTTVNPVTQ